MLKEAVYRAIFQPIDTTPLRGSLRSPLAARRTQMETPGVEITEKQKNILTAMALSKASALPSSAKQMALTFKRGDLGIILSDDNSGVPFEILGALTGEKGWYEEDWIEVANLETIKKAKKENDISVANLKAGDVLKKKNNSRGGHGWDTKQEDESDEEDEGAMDYYREMMGRGGMGGGSGRQETKEEPKPKVRSDVGGGRGGGMGGAKKVRRRSGFFSFLLFLVLTHFAIRSAQRSAYRSAESHQGGT